MYFFISVLNVVTLNKKRFTLLSYLTFEGLKARKLFEFQQHAQLKFHAHLSQT